MSAQDSWTAQDMCDALNRMLGADPEALRRLVMDRVPCNAALADDPAAQVKVDGESLSIGLVGVLNGALGIRDGWGPIGAIVEESGEVTSFVPTPAYSEDAQPEPEEEPGFGQEVVDGAIVWKGDYGPKDVAKCRRCLRVQGPEHMDLSDDGYLCKAPCVRHPDSEMEENAP